MGKTSDLNWGASSPDGYDQKNNSSFYTLNHYMISEEARSLTAKYIIGKILWHQKQLPKNCSFIIDVDLQGQEEIEFEFELMNEWRDTTLQEIKRKQPKINIEMNFII